MRRGYHEALLATTLTLLTTTLTLLIAQEKFSAICRSLNPNSEKVRETEILSADEISAFFMYFIVLYTPV